MAGGIKLPQAVFRRLSRLQRPSLLLPEVPELFDSIIGGSQRLALVAVACHDAVAHLAGEAAEGSILPAAVAEGNSVVPQHDAVFNILASVRQNVSDYTLC